MVGSSSVIHLDLHVQHPAEVAVEPEEKRRARKVAAELEKVVAKSGKDGAEPGKVAFESEKVNDEPGKVAAEAGKATAAK